MPRGVYVSSLTSDACTPTAATPTSVEINGGDGDEMFTVVGGGDDKTFS